MAQINIVYYIVTLKNNNNIEYYKFDGNILNNKEIMIKKKQCPMFLSFLVTKVQWDSVLTYETVENIISIITVGIAFILTIYSSNYILCTMYINF